ncbi:MAG: hypothetical protein WEF50_10755 [Myxococcota bacterium]
MAKRQTIPEASDPLSAILGKGTSPAFRIGRALPEAAQAPDAVEEPTQKVGFRLPISLCEEIRDCVVFLQGPPLHLTVSEFGEEACRRELERLRDAHNGGREFPSRQKEPRTGRPVG